MSWNRFLNSIALAAALLTAATPGAAAGFGTVVPLSGQASDMALDESRGVLYIANFTANRIEVMSTQDLSIRTSMNVAPQPGALTLSRDGQWLLVVHYGNWEASDPNRNLITLINLRDNSRQTFATGDPPLAAAFMADGRAIIITTTSFIRFDPVAGSLTAFNTFANLCKTLPVDAATFPSQVVEAALTTSGDGWSIWGIAGGGTGKQLVFRYHTMTGFYAQTWITTPPLLPRVSVPPDGSWAMIGWAAFSFQGVILGRYPHVIASTNVTGHAIDSNAGIIYAQIPDESQPLGPPYTSGTLPAAQASSAKLPVLLIMDADNLTVRERVAIPESMIGRTVLNSSASILYAISDSGVMVLPVGSLNQYPRLAASQEDLLVQTNFCNSSQVGQSFTITDPGGGHTDFTIAPDHAGVTVSPSSGVTPATVQVRVDPSSFQNASGTTAVLLQISSAKAINLPRPVRLLMNYPDQDQRGTVINVPGTLGDILADPHRNRIYVLRQDTNQILVFDGSTYAQIAALRTATTPNSMSFTIDRKNLLVGHADSQLIHIFDLDTLLPDVPIPLPGSHYAHSIAESSGAVLVLARSDATSKGVVDYLDLAGHRAYALASLGVFKNEVSPEAVLAPAPNGRSILLAAPDGNVMLYAADANTFTLSRKDFTSLSGAYAASSYDSFVVGNNILNASLVPVGSMDATLGVSSGFAFVDRGGYRVTSASAAGPGVMQDLDTLTAASVRPVRMSEAPLVPPKTGGFTRTVAALPSAGAVVALTISGFTVLSSDYAAAVAPPVISAVSNAADGTLAVAPGSLISVWGRQMSPVSMGTQRLPLPTTLGDSCLSVNGSPVPLLFVSGQQINAQLPFNVVGKAALTIHTTGGISDNYNLTVSPTAPGVFRCGVAGPETGLATIVRADNNQLITPTNPIHANDTLIIYLTGLGATTPLVEAGVAAPSSPLATAMIQPTVTLGGRPLNVFYAGLAPGFVGLYQINAVVPFGVPQGLDIPLVIDQGGASTTLSVRVVK